MIKKTKFITFRGSLKIVGYEYRDEKKEKLPALILSHGFMANMKMCRKYAKTAATEGYAAFIFDFNGGGLFSKSSGNTTEMSVLSEKEDLKTVIDYVCTLPYVRKDHILLLGCSQGGFVSALTAAELKEKIDKLILFYPALCIPDDARKGSMMFAHFSPKNIPDTIKCGPMKLGRCYPEAVLSMDPYEEIRAYGGPVLIVHGTKDRIVPLRYSEKARDSYPDATLRIIEGGTHMFFGKADKLAIGFLKEFLRN